LFSTTIRRVVRTGSRSTRLPKSSVRVNHRASQSTKIPPISRKALPLLGASLAGTALLGSFSLFTENRALAASLSNSLEEKESRSVANSKENRKQHSWNMPLAMTYFVGRKELSDMIVTRLGQAMQHSNVNHPPIVLSGMGGIGKTQLAVHCLKRMQTISSTHCFWFEAESPDRLDATYRSFYIEIIKKSSEKAVNVQVQSEVHIEGEITAQGNIDIRGVNLHIERAELTPDDIRSIVKGWFADHPDCILVYDNVKDYASIQKFLPTSGGQVMVLTRRAEWPAHFTMFPLNPLKRAESITLLTEFGQVQGEDKSVAELANKLEDLPLALAQAGAYMRYKKKSTENYLQLYNKYRAKMLANGTMPAGIAHSPVMVTWEVSLKEIDQQDASGITRTVFTLCAYGAPEGALRNLLQHYLEEKGIPESELKVDEAITQLRNYSLLEVSEDRKKLVVHRLVQEVTRIHHENERTPQRDDLIAWYTPWLTVTEKQFALLDSDKKKMDYLTQALAVIEHQERLFSEKENSKNLALAELKNQAGTVLFHHGFYHAAKEQLECVLKIRERCEGLKHINVAEVLNDLAISYGALGNARKQCDLLERALMIHEVHYGKNHVGIARTLNHLGIAYRLLGDYVKARDCLERALKIKQAHYGKDHVKVAITLTNLGSVYGSLGDHTKKRDVLECALKIEEAYYGKDHVNVAIMLNNLGNAYNSLGDYAKARGCLERALKTMEAHYGKDHVEAAKTLTNLGITYGSLGDYAKERDLLKRALKIKEIHYGKNHLETAAALGSIGDAYSLLGDYVTMRDILERVLKIKEAHYGKDHVAVTDTLNNLGCAYGSLGDHVKERDYLERSLKIREAHYGKDHIEVAGTLNNLGNVYNFLGDHAKERNYLERALKIKEAHYGKNHVDVAMTLNDLGSAYGSLGEYARERDILERALKITEAHYGKNHVKVAMILHNLGNTYGSLDNHAKELDLLERALSIKEAHYGKDHGEVAKTLVNLCIAYDSLGDYTNERRLLERTLKIFMNSPVHGREHPYTQMVINQLSFISLVIKTPQTLFTPNKKPPSIGAEYANDSKLGVKPNGR